METEEETRRTREEQVQERLDRIKLLTLHRRCQETVHKECRDDQAEDVRLSDEEPEPDWGPIRPVSVVRFVIGLVVVIFFASFFLYLDGVIIERTGGRPEDTTRHQLLWFLDFWR